MWLLGYQVLQKDWDTFFWKRVSRLRVARYFKKGRKTNSFLQQIKKETPKSVFSVPDESVILKIIFLLFLEREIQL